MSIFDLPPLNFWLPSGPHERIFDTTLIPSFFGPRTANPDPGIRFQVLFMCLGLWLVSFCLCAFVCLFCFVLWLCFLLEFYCFLCFLLLSVFKQTKTTRTKNTNTKQETKTKRQNTRKAHLAVVTFIVLILFNARQSHEKVHVTSKNVTWKLGKFW